jgi:hypothetical protein
LIVEQAAGEDGVTVVSQWCLCRCEFVDDHGNANPNRFRNPNRPATEIDYD